jgi:hypothetical protein
MTIEAVRDLLMRLDASTRALAALGLAVDERVQGVPLDPAIKTEIDHVLTALGARDMLEGLTAAELTPLLAEIRLTLLLNAQLLLSPARTGWTHTEGELLQSIGEFSATFPNALKQTLPRLEGLADRLESPDGALLDVGVGIGAIAIAMARVWPRLRVVGIDPGGRPSPSRATMCRGPDSTRGSSCASRRHRSSPIRGPSIWRCSPAFSSLRP